MYIFTEECTFLQKEAELCFPEREKSNESSRGKKIKKSHCIFILNTPRIFSNKDGNSDFISDRKAAQSLLPDKKIHS